MNGAQANALMANIAAASLPADAEMRFVNGAQVWSVSFPTGTPMTGDQVGQLAAYCDTHALTLSLVFSSMTVT